MGTTSLSDTILWWTAWGILFAILMGWLARSRRGANVRHRELRMPTAILVIGVVPFAVLFARTCTGLIWGLTDPKALWLALGSFLISLIFAPLVSSFYLERHVLTDEGMLFRNIVGTRKQIRWSEPRSVSYLPTMWFSLETRSGVVARVSVLLAGLPEFARLVLSKSSPEALDAPARTALENTAAGRLPSLYDE